MSGLGSRTTAPSIQQMYADMEKRAHKAEAKVKTERARRVRAEEALRQIRDNTSDLIRARQIARTALEENEAVGGNTP